MAPACRVGLLGGTFDPPHLGHLVLAAAARRSLALDEVLFVPAGDPWRKRGTRPISPAAARRAMVAAAVAPLPWAAVSDVELDREGPTYTAETLERLGAERPGTAWWFIVGGDALSDLPHWHAPERILALARLAVAGRPDQVAATGLVPAPVRDALPGIVERVDAVEMPALAVSSTDLRARVAAGRETAVLLPEGVARVAAAHGLYRDADGGSR